ncbi:MAG: hypothetical protein ACRDMI_13925 [Streptosporangiaceae bacterium]
MLTVTLTGEQQEAADALARIGNHRYQNMLNDHLRRDTWAA